MATRWLILRHPREASRASNTAKLLLDSPLSVCCEDWSRAAPEQPLLPDECQFLLYPDDDDAGVVRQDVGESMWTTIEAALAEGRRYRFVLLDATWQESWSMYRRSPGLHSLPRLGLKACAPSRFRLRTGHRPGQLSTVETVIEVLRRLGQQDQADALSQRFEGFMEDFNRGLC